MDKNLQNCDVMQTTNINDTMKNNQTKGGANTEREKVWKYGHYYTPECVQWLILSNLFLGNFAD